MRVAGHHHRVKSWGQSRRDIRYCSGSFLAWRSGKKAFAVEIQEQGKSSLGEFGEEGSTRILRTCGLC